MSSLIPFLFTLGVLTPIKTCILFGGLWILGLGTYRLYLSPIAKFPGPTLAALTSWYEFYFDVVKGGQYTFHLQELHKRYGPIIRINPTELHIDDPEYYETIYSHNVHLDKLMSFNHRWNAPGAAQVTGPHDLHRLRRSALNPFFSKRQVILFWPYILEKSEKLCQKITETYCETGKPLNLTKAFGCYSLDVITEYAFGNSYNDLDNEEFYSGLAALMDPMLKQVHLITHLPWMLTFLNSMPVKVQELLHPGLVVIHEYQKGVTKVVQSVIDEKEQNAKMEGHKTIFHEILDSDLPRKELSLKRLSDEANIIIGAGSDTVKHALSVATFYILNDQTIHRRLCEELIKAMPDKLTTLTWTELEKLPYLTAVIQEALRLSYGVAQRSPRISPKEPLHYQGQIIPPGFAVSMDPVNMHHNENIFPNSHKFSPERWIEDGSSKKIYNGKNLQRYNIAFSRGTRQCAGMNLAYAELYLILSMLFRRYEMELFETDVNSVKLYADFFLPTTKPGTQGVQVLTASRRT